MRPKPWIQLHIMGMQWGYGDAMGIQYNGTMFFGFNGCVQDTPVG